MSTGLIYRSRPNFTQQDVIERHMNLGAAFGQAAYRPKVRYVPTEVLAGPPGQRFSYAAQGPGMYPDGAGPMTEGEGDPLLKTATPSGPMPKYLDPLDPANWYTEDVGPEDIDDDLGDTSTFSSPTISASESMSGQPSVGLMTLQGLLDQQHPTDPQGSDTPGTSKHFIYGKGPSYELQVVEPEEVPEGKEGKEPMEEEGEPNEFLMLENEDPEKVGYGDADASKDGETPDIVVTNLVEQLKSVREDATTRILKLDSEKFRILKRQNAIVDQLGEKARYGEEYQTIRKELDKTMEALSVLPDFKTVVSGLYDYLERGSKGEKLQQSELIEKILLINKYGKYVEGIEGLKDNLAKTLFFISRGNLTMGKEGSEEE